MPGASVAALSSAPPLPWAGRGESLLEPFDASVNGMGTTPGPVGAIRPGTHAGLDAPRQIAVSQIAVDLFCPGLFEVLGFRGLAQDRRTSFRRGYFYHSHAAPDPQQGPGL